MGKSFNNLQANFDIINQHSKNQTGISYYNNIKSFAEIQHSNDYCTLTVETVIDLNINNIEIDFINNERHLKIQGAVVANRSKLNTSPSSVKRCSEIKIYQLQSKHYHTTGTYYLRSFYFIGNNRILRDFSISDKIPLTVNNNTVRVSSAKGYLILESMDCINENTFSDLCYNMLVGIGFISGKFIQSNVYTFKHKDDSRQNLIGYSFEKLRPSNFSIYHALTSNPFSYEEMIGSNHAKQLYEKNILIPFDQNSLIELTKLIWDNPQIQYAIVLFNEANSNNLSLLVKNSSFYVVIEVIKKFLFDHYANLFSTNYSQKGNMEKYKTVFGKVVSLTSDELELLKKRNALLHGDIKDLGGQEMVDIMQQQITFIYRIILTFVKFNGYIINHFAIRNNKPDEAFIKLSPPIFSEPT